MEKVKENLQTTEQRPEEEFINNLEQAIETNRAAIAAFKRAIGCSIAEDTNAMKYFYQMLPYPVIGKRIQEEIYFLIATLFAYTKRKGNISLPDALKKIKSSQKDTSSIERRFSILLDSNFEKDPFGSIRPGELGNRLKGVISILKSNNEYIDWVSLLTDLLRWDHPDRIIQKKWARIFYKKEKLPTDTPNQS